MEAATLKMKKQMKKGKLKRTMKNVMCRPDPTFWPQTSEDEGKTLIKALYRLKADIPDFKKPVWSELRHIPKQLRPKPAPIPRVEGLIFGITECQKAIETEECIAVLIEAEVNPKTIVKPLIETCTDKSVPVLCLKMLRSITRKIFCIPTSVLGVKQNFLPELEKKILEIYNCHKPPKKQTTINVNEEICATANPQPKEITDVEIESVCPYLYRTDKKIRVFTPLVEDTTNISNKFVGQNYIQLSNNLQNEYLNSTEFMKMVVKKISSNPNRRKDIKGSPKD